MPELTKEALVDIVKKRRPSSFAALKKSLIEENISASDNRLIQLIDELQSEGKVNLSILFSGSFRRFLLDLWFSWWFYLSLIIAISELLLVSFNASTGIALFLRIVFGLGVLGIIPGFLTVSILFPGGQLNNLEKAALSIFLSVMISIAIADVLGLGPFFLASNNIIILAVYVILADLGASYRSYNLLRRPL